MPTTETFKDLAVSLVTSGYKWLTQKLYNAQQAFTVRPYFTAQVIDDTIQPTGLSTTPFAPYSRGSAAPTPDGNIVAAGFGNADGFIHFYKGRNLAGGWDTDIILDTDTSILSSTANNQVAIAVSEMAGGTYRIDVAYFYNFDNHDTLGFLRIKLKYSDDGGVTWNTPLFGTGLPYTDYNSGPAKNLFIALQKPRLMNGVMTSGISYITPQSSVLASGYTNYNVNNILYNSGGVNTNTGWDLEANSLDWTILTIDWFYLNDGYDYLVFSGFRNIIDFPSPKSTLQSPNYALWMTRLKRKIPGGVNDVWTVPVNIIPADSAVIANQNQFTYPRATVQNGYVDIVLKALTVDSISQTSQGTTGTVVTTHENYLLIRSVDGLRFTYPQILVDANDNEIVEVDSKNQLLSFVSQDDKYYILGCDQKIQFQQNNIVADITADVISYNIQEAAGQPSSLNLQLANQNNQWVGAAPTKPGASAIARNRKIAIWQGYYNSDKNPELVPRNVYFIDDITQNISSKQSDVALVGRDWFKKLKTLVTRYSLQWIGPLFYTDIFDGSTLGNWTQQQNSWQETSNQLVTIQAYTNDSIITLARSAQIPFESRMILNAQMPASTGAILYIYAVFIDTNNFLRLKLTKTGSSSYDWVIQRGYVAGGVPTIAVEDSGSISINGTDYIGFFVRQYGYYKWNFCWTDTGTSFSGNPLTPWNSMNIFANGGSGEIDLSNFFATNTDWQVPYAIGLGSNNFQPSFTYFRYVQFGPVTNILSVIKSLASIAGVMAFKIQETFVEYFFTPNFVGNYRFMNRTLIVPPGGTTFNNDGNKDMGNGEIIFKAKATPLVTGVNQQFGFTFLFRGNNKVALDDSYALVVTQINNNTGFSWVTFGRYFSGTFYLFPNNAINTPLSYPNTQLGSLRLDLTKYHEFRITMVDGWMYAYVDDTMVAAFNDNTTDGAYLKTGYWGFLTDANSQATIKDISSPIFWKPVKNFSLNPGDDVENAVLSLAQSIRGWVFSDLMGRMKVILLSSTDLPDYTYDNQLWSQDVDESDKEYVSQVTVYGTGVMATARNTSVMAGIPVREFVVVDYTITTQSDAQVRANNELLNQNQFLNQYTPQQIINVGAELFDTVTVINTGNNTSGVDAPTRVYAQNIAQGGGNNQTDYSLQLQTGNL